MICACSLGHLTPTIARTKPSHILSLLSPNQDTPRIIESGNAQTLRLSFNDIREALPNLIVPSTALIQQIVSFSRSWPAERPLLIHCWAGISRSSAAAYIIACDRNPGYEETIAATLRARAPFATPNSLMITLADAFFERGGRMVEAIERIGRGADAFEGMPYTLPIAWPN